MPSNPAVAATVPNPQKRNSGPSPAPQRDALASIYALAAEDFAAVNALIPRQLTSQVGLVEEIGHHIVESGGKRLRPLMVLLGARCCHYQGDAHIRLATIIEFLHTATLLHDDVVDHSELRRGQATANALWGNSPSVLVGDFLYSRAFQLMVELESMDIMAILSDATNTIAEGEVLQLANVGNCSIDENQYMDVIRCKTAMLFQAATHTAGVLATEDPEEVTALRDFGLHFGLAYQLVDDWLDYAGDAATMGKNVGDDLAEGKLTLPLIHALANAPVGADVIRQALAERSTERMDEVLRVVQSSGALDYTHEAAITQSERAIERLAVLPDNEYRDAFHTLARFCVDRLR